MADTKGTPVNRDQLKADLLGAVGRHWRTSMDRSGPTPEMGDDLVAIAERYAVDHARNVEARRELREQAAAPPLVAAEVTVTTGTGSTSLGGPAGPLEGGSPRDSEAAATAGSDGATAAHRTRTRPRGGPK
jgi:hypothetical protein